jgi:N-methylhydantoinase A
LEEQAWEEMRKNKVGEDKVSFFHSLDLRYYGQRHPIEVSIPSTEIHNINYIIESFHELHLRKYGFKVRENEIELLNFRLAAIGEVVKPALETFEKKQDESKLKMALKETRKVFLESGYRDCPVYDRDLIPASKEIPGPAVVEQLDSTSLVLPGQTAIVDEYLNLTIAL